MFGVLIALVIFTITSFCGLTSFWWLWGSMIGGSLEIVTRLGIGEPLAEILGAISDLGEAIAQILSCFKGSDSSE